jgi:hypothetical protein
MGTYITIKSKLNDNVIDIQGASTKAGALLDAFTPKTSGNQNQQWEFIPDPSGSGYYFIKSALNGNVIDILGASTNPGTLLDAYPQKTTGLDNQLWAFIPDPANPGCFFIASALNGNVIDIQGSINKSGVVLDAYPRKTTGTDNQLWMPIGGTFPPPAKQLPTSLTWTNLGTGSGTTSSGATECSYSLNLTVQQDGSCHFWGSYTNRGDVPIITAPNQSWGVSFVLLDVNGKGYSFNSGGNAPSAPQNGSTQSWNTTQTIPAITQNWNAIAARHSGVYAYDNDVSILDFAQEILNATESAISTIGTVISDVAPVVEAVAAALA